VVQLHRSLLIIKILPRLTALAVILLSTAALTAVPTGSKITATTVYLDRTVITRTATAELTSALNLLAEQRAKITADQAALEPMLKWTLDLKPGEKREITLKFSIDHLADISVSGLQSAVSAGCGRFGEQQIVIFGPSLSESSPAQRKQRSEGLNPPVVWARSSGDEIDPDCARPRI